MVRAESSWNCADLAHALCDALVARGHLKEKPAFIRTDREAKIASIFESVGLDGEKMNTFDNPGPLEMLVRKGTNGEAWVGQVIEALVQMLPEEAATAAKKMTMDDNAKEELAAAKEKSAQRRDRLQAQEEEQREQRREEGGGEGRGKGRGKGRGDREGGERGERNGGGGFRDREDGDRGDRGGSDRWGDMDRPQRRDRDDGDRWGDSGGRPRMDRDRDGDRPPRGDGEKGKGKGKRDRDRSAMQCLNCKQYGHKSRDCPEPVNEDAVRERLAAKAAGRPIVPPRGKEKGDDN